MITTMQSIFHYAKYSLAGWLAGVTVMVSNWQSMPLVIK